MSKSTVIRTAQAAALRVLPALALAFSLALTATVPAFAQGAEQAANNFTTLMTNVARASAAGFFFGGLVVIAIGVFGGMPKLAASGKASSLFGVALFLAQRLYTFATETAGGILG